MSPIPTKRLAFFAFAAFLPFCLAAWPAKCATSQDAGRLICIPQDYPSIQAGIDASSHGDTIRVAPGRYFENIDFRGKRITVESLENAGNTIIDGKRSASTVIFWNGEDRHSVLRGFTITNGLARDPRPFPFGGGVCIRDASPIVSGCRIISNGSQYMAGGVYVEGSQASPLIENNLIAENIATERGGGIVIREGASGIVRNNTISENLAMEGSGVEIVNGSSPIIVNNLIRGNVAGYDLSGHHAEKYLDGVDVTENLGQCAVISGGILVVQDSSPIIRNNDIIGNCGGGIGVFLNSAPTVVGNVITGNRGRVADGIMAALHAAPKIGNNVIRNSDNSAAIWVEKSSHIEYLDANQVSGPVISWPQSPPERPALSSNRTLTVPGHYNSIQGAINDAIDGETILVSPGIYRENLDILGKRITISSLDPDDVSIVEVTIIEAENPGPTISFMNGESRETVLSGFTIRNRFDEGQNGSGISISGSSPTISKNIISECRGTAIRMGWPCHLFQTATEPLIQENQIIDNHGQTAGGIFFVFASPEIIGNKIIGNHSTGGGGALSSWFSHPIIANNRIEYNESIIGTVSFDHYSQPVIKNNTIAFNRAQMMGGAIYLDDFCNALIEENIITENRAGLGAGISMILDCRPRLVNNLIARNTGGAIFISACHPELVHNTIANNPKEEGQQWSVGIQVMANSRVRIANTIFYESDIILFDPAFSTIDASCSLLKGEDGMPWPGKGNLADNPFFADGGSYRLQPLSPCRDGGCDEGIYMDLAGNERPGGPGFDIGAYEFSDVAKWRTEIGVINPDRSSLEGILRGFTSSGAEVWRRNLQLRAYARLQLDIGMAAAEAAEQIKHMRLDISKGKAVGYQKFYHYGKYRVGLEAMARANQARLFLPHIASNNNWWTGIGLVNTHPAARELMLVFADDSEKGFPIGPGCHDAFLISDLFEGVKQPNAGSAFVDDGGGIIGLELFGAENQLSGVGLGDQAEKVLIFPHIAQTGKWWTGIGIYNPGPVTASLSRKIYTRQGELIREEPSFSEILPNQKYTESIVMPTEAAWFAIESTEPVAGFELFGRSDGSQLAGYSVVNLAANQGVFPKMETTGWTGIALVNPSRQTARVCLEAKDDSGERIAATSLEIEPRAKVVDVPENLFQPHYVSRAMYIHFTADRDLVGFQLNGSRDGSMLDAVGALGSRATMGTDTLYFPHIAAGE
jgi:parallel beta-helix repeat protein